MRGLVNYNYNNLGSLHEYDNITTDEYPQIIQMITNKLPELITTQFGDKYKIQDTLTEAGFCYSFNSKIAIFSSTEYLQSNIHSPTTPSLYVTNYIEGDGWASLLIGQTCNIHFHAPYEQLNPLKFYTTIKNSSSYTNFVFTGVATHSEKRVRQLLVFQRKCRFWDESDLVHFPQFYSYNLCKIDCRIQAMQRYCNCLPFWYKPSINDVYCTIKGLKCVAHFKDKIEAFLMKNCNCLRDCDSVSFMLRSVKSIVWGRPTTVKWELTKANLRVRREVIYTLTDVLGLNLYCV